MFQELAEEIVARGDPAALTVLAGAVADDVARAAARELELREVERRFGPGLEDLRRDRAGFTFADGRAILAGVEAAYVVEPDRGAMARAAERRLADLWASPAVNAAFPLTARAPATGRPLPARS